MTALRLTNLGMPVESPEEALPSAAAARLGIADHDIVRWRILRKSLDARSRHELRFVYSMLVELPDDAAVERLVREPGVERFSPPAFEEPLAGTVALEERPIVVGSGPGGILAAYYLAQRGYRPLVLERGDPVKSRVPAIRDFDRGGPHDPENNYLFGEGGAGTFSDGKLTCRMTGPDVDWVLEHIVNCGARPSIRFEQRPHLGSNRLPMIVRNFRRRIEEWGGEYRFRCRLEGLEIVDGRLRGVRTSSGYLRTAVVVLATGHSARDTYQMLYESSVPMEAKAFQLGLRIEQPQAAVDRQKYPHARYLDILGHADYSLVAHGTRDVFTFCMCAGGYIIPSVSEPGMFCTNGMSNSRHDSPFANSGIVATLEPREFGDALRNGAVHPLAGVQLQRRFETIAYRLGRGTYATPLQRVGEFLAGHGADGGPPPACSYSRGSVLTSLDQVLPPAIAKAIRTGLPIMDRSWSGAFLRDAVLVGPEMRGSSPVRLMRGADSRESPGIEGLFPVGEGAGFAGGIISAAVDGLRTAKTIVGRYAPLESRG